MCVCHHGKMSQNVLDTPTVVGTTTEVDLSTLLGVYIPVCLRADFVTAIASQPCKMQYRCVVELKMKAECGRSKRCI